MTDDVLDERLSDLKTAYHAGSLDGLSLSPSLRARIHWAAQAGAPRRHRRPWTAAAASLLVLAGAAGTWAHLNSAHGHPPSGGLKASGGAVAAPTAAPAHIDPTITGIASSISHGHLHLTQVGYSLPQGMARPPADVPLPPGHFVAPGHWQATGDRMDIFLGQKVVYLIRSGVVMPTLHFFQGEVKAVKGNTVTVTAYMGAWASPDHWSRPLGTVTLTLPPYSRTRLSAPPKPGEKGIIGWFGSQNDPLVWQAGWVGGTIPAHAVDLSCPQSPHQTIAATPAEVRKKGKAWLCRVYGAPMPQGAMNLPS